jgi:hypothetical protein
MTFLEEQIIKHDLDASEVFTPEEVLGKITEATLEKLETCTVREMIWFDWKHTQFHADDPEMDEAIAEIVTDRKAFIDRQEVERVEGELSAFFDHYTEEEHTEHHEWRPGDPFLDLVDFVQLGITIYRR